jgi:hypothetical protein
LIVVGVAEELKATTVAHCSVGSKDVIGTILKFKAVFTVVVCVVGDDLVVAGINTYARIIVVCLAVLDNIIFSGQIYTDFTYGELTASIERSCALAIDRISEAADYDSFRYIIRASAD